VALERGRRDEGRHYLCLKENPPKRGAVLCDPKYATGGRNHRSLHDPKSVRRKYGKEKDVVYRRREGSVYHRFRALEKKERISSFAGGWRGIVARRERQQQKRREA